MSKLEWVLMENSVFAPLSAIAISEADYDSLLTDGTVLQCVAVCCSVLQCVGTIRY